MKRKIDSIILILIGFALLLYLTVGISSGKSADLLTWGIAALGAGAALKGWLDLFKKDARAQKSIPPPATVITPKHYPYDRSEENISPPQNLAAAFCPLHGPYDASLGACPYPHGGASSRPIMPPSLDSKDEGATEIPAIRRHGRNMLDFDEEEATEIPRRRFYDDDCDRTEGEGVTKPDDVSFTAYHPKEGGIESWHTLLVYTHLFSMLTKIQKDVKRFADQIKSPKETTSITSTLIMRGTELTIVPSCKGVTFNPERISFKWLEDFHRADFRFKADKSLLDDAAKGTIDIYAGPLIIGALKFAMLFNGKDLQPALDHEEHAKMYGKDDVFISYSRKDTEVARAFKTILDAIGFDVFLDVDNLRPGQLWQAELQRRIERAGIFQMFWSENYSQSETCKMEWEHALKQKKEEGYIRPVYWKSPLSPNPPDELGKFNFQYVELLTISKD
jgi:hypothetical protein